MPAPMLVVGSVAFDTLHNSLGTHPRVLGGAATYASLCASYYTDVQLVGVVGNDYPDSAIEMLKGRGIDLAGLEVADGLTFHWEGRYSDDLSSRETIATDLNVFAEFQPKVPDSFKDAPYVMLANIQPDLQHAVLDQVSSPKLVVADTMNLWIDIARDSLDRLMKRVDVLVINEEEARQITGKYNLVDVSQGLLELGPETVIVKQGEYGAWLFREGQIFHAPAYPLETVSDPTGAGDSFAGGFIGYLAMHDKVDFATMKRAVVHGSATASFCVEGVAIGRLGQLDMDAIEERVARFDAIVAS